MSDYVPSETQARLEELGRVMPCGHEARYLARFATGDQVGELECSVCAVEKIAVWDEFVYSTTGQHGLEHLIVRYKEMIAENARFREALEGGTP